MTVATSGAATSSALARMLALSFLLLSVAPLGSLYAVFFSPHPAIGYPIASATKGPAIVVAGAEQTADEQQQQQPPPISSSVDEELEEDVEPSPQTSHKDSSASSPPSEQQQQQVPISKSLVETLQNPNATLEEIWTALLQERGNASDDVWMMVLGGAPTGPSSHWHVIIPWALAILLGIGMPLCASFIEYIRGGDNYINGDVQDSEASLERRKRRKLTRLVLAVKEYRKVLTEEDFCHVIAEDEDEGIPRLRLPWPGDEISSPAASLSTRTVPGSCVVCFNPYQVGKPVIWSSNPKCPHAFCEECILSWLLRQRLRRKEKQCPCCRRPFLVQKTD